MGERTKKTSMFALKLKPGPSKKKKKLETRPRPKKPALPLCAVPGQHPGPHGRDSGGTEHDQFGLFPGATGVPSSSRTFASHRMPRCTARPTQRSAATASSRHGHGSASLGPRLPNPNLKPAPLAAAVAVPTRGRWP